MSNKYWTDKNGVEWPYWCGFELQTCAKSTSDKSKSPKNDIPDWLLRLCRQSSGDEVLGDRNGVRYDFPQMVLIVQSIKSWCLEQDVRLPGIEALPVTIGMINEIELEAAKLELRAAERRFNLAKNELSRLEQSGRQMSELAPFQIEFQEAMDGIELVQESIELAKQDLEEASITLPLKRLARKTIQQETESTPSISEGEVSRKRGWSESQSQGRKKVKLDDE
jgi:hypothetical protein